MQSTGDRHMNITRRAATALAIGLTFFSGAALALAASKFEQKSFEAALKSGKPVLVHVSAPWCPTCKAQAPILEKLRSDNRFNALQAFDVDFDSQKDALRALKATSQSTIIVFKGGAEAGRSAGDTTPASIETLLKKAL
jgi:thiol-disulfide isomerase/thioredoxin